MELVFASHYNRYNKSTCNFLLTTRDRKALMVAWQGLHTLTS